MTKNKDGVLFASSKYFIYDHHIQWGCAHRITPTQDRESSNVTVTRRHQLSQSSRVKQIQQSDLELPMDYESVQQFVPGIWTGVNVFFVNCCGWHEEILPHLLQSVCAATEIGAIDFTASHAHSGEGYRVEITWIEGRDRSVATTNGKFQRCGDGRILKNE